MSLKLQYVLLAVVDDMGPLGRCVYHPLRRACLALLAWLAPCILRGVEAVLLEVHVGLLLQLKLRAGYEGRRWLRGAKLVDCLSTGLLRHTLADAR